MKAILIPNLVEYHSVSLKRYGRELTQALTNLHAPNWQFESLTCHHVEPIAKLVPGKLGAVTAERVGRLVEAG